MQVAPSGEEVCDEFDTSPDDSNPSFLSGGFLEDDSSLLQLSQVTTHRSLSRLRRFSGNQSLKRTLGGAESKNSEPVVRKLKVVFSDA